MEIRILIAILLIITTASAGRIKHRKRGVLNHHQGRFSAYAFGHPVPQLPRLSYHLRHGGASVASYSANYPRFRKIVLQTPPAIAVGQRPVHFDQGYLNVRPVPVNINRPPVLQNPASFGYPAHHILGYPQGDLPASTVVAAGGPQFIAYPGNHQVIPYPSGNPAGNHHIVPYPSGNPTENHHLVPYPSGNPAGNHHTISYPSENPQLVTYPSNSPQVIHYPVSNSPENPHHISYPVNNPTDNHHFIPYPFNNPSINPHAVPYPPNNPLIPLTPRPVVETPQYPTTDFVQSQVPSALHPDRVYPANTLSGNPIVPAVPVLPPTGGSRPFYTLRPGTFPVFPITSEDGSTVLATAQPGYEPDNQQTGQTDVPAEYPTESGYPTQSGYPSVVHRPQQHMEGGFYGTTSSTGSQGSVYYTPSTASTASAANGGQGSNSQQSPWTPMHPVEETQPSAGSGSGPDHAYHHQATSGSAPPAVSLLPPYYRQRYHHQREQQQRYQRANQDDYVDY